MICGCPQICANQCSGTASKCNQNVMKFDYILITFRSQIAKNGTRGFYRDHFGPQDAGMIVKTNRVTRLTKFASRRPSVTKM